MKVMLFGFDTLACNGQQRQNEESKEENFHGEARRCKAAGE